MKTPILALLALFTAQSAEPPRLVVPNTPDLTIRTRRVYDKEDSSIFIDVVYLKGARQRRDRIVERPQIDTAAGGRRTLINASITQCDARRTVFLYPQAKTYLSSPIESPAQYQERARRLANQARPPEPTGGGVVNITIDSVDTGERRQVGPFVARHVITTMTTEPGPGASTRANASREDSWYIDLPPANCWDWGNQPPPLGFGVFGMVRSANAPPDREQVDFHGTGRRGYPIEETGWSETEVGRFTTKLELIELSDAPLDSALFAVPADYQPALPRLFGGYDLTKADTLSNRLQSYWEDLGSRVNRLFR